MRNKSILKNRNVLFVAVMSAMALGSIHPVSAYAQDLVLDGTDTQTINTTQDLGTDAVNVGVTNGSNATLTIDNGGVLSNGISVIGVDTGSEGTVIVTGTGIWAPSLVFVVGENGTGTLTIEKGGAVVNSNGQGIVIGDNAGSVGTVTVSGAGSTWSNAQPDSTLIVGADGTGTLTVSDGGTVGSSSGVVGNSPGSIGTVTVTGEGSTWAMSGDTLLVGDLGAGTLTIADGGTVNVAGTVTLAMNDGSAGMLNIGAAAGDAAVAAGTLNADAIQFGNVNGTLVFNHTDTAYDFSADMSGLGTIQQLAGTTDLTGDSSGFTGQVTITGGTLNVTGQLGSSGGAIAGSTEDAAVNVSGAGANWINSTGLAVGLASAGALTVSDGGLVSDSYSFVGYGADSTGTATITGAGSTWSHLSTLYIGVNGNGTLTLSDGGEVDTGGTVIIASQDGSTGTLNIGAAAGEAAAAAGTLDTNWVTLGSGNASIVFNHTETDYNFNAPISGAGTLEQIAGVTDLTGDTSGFTGTTNVTGGTLKVNDTLGGTVNVTGGTLGGSGTLSGNVAVTGGAIAPGNSPGTLTIGGDLALAAGSSLDFQLGSPSGTAGTDSDLIDVGGNLTLDGTLNVADAGGFGAGLYRLINYGGTLTDNGLDIGAAPAGYNSTNLTVQTATAGQVNLLVGTPVASFSFWDGANTGANNAVDGGTATWTATGTNWTVADGSANGAFDPAALLIFAGTPGTVVVDDSAGAIAIHNGMQFAVNGYAVNGDALSLTGANFIRVGDGTDAGLEYTATIASNLTGTGSLEKTDLGTLVLTGANTYTGGTTVSAGALVGDTGSLQGNIVNDAVLVFYQTSAGTYAGVISGTGSLVKNGTGALTLTGANSYSGGTTLSAGTLIGNTTSLQGNIVNNAALVIDQASAGTYAGVISGTGSLTKDGAGALTLTGANSYSGGTTLSAGTLVGNTTSLQGDIVNHAALTFDQTTTGTYAGAISGNGTLAKTGAGELVLTGDSSAYTGTTDITAGVLAVNGALGGAIQSSGGTLGGSGTLGNVVIAAGGTLAPGNSIGTLNVANVTLDAGSTYAVQLDDGGFVAGTNNDLLNATGTATINGGTVHVAPENGTDDGSTYTPGTYTILTAAGGVSGTFDALTDDYAFLAFALGYDANHVFLTSSLASTGFCLTGMSGNQCAAGNAVFSQGADHGVYDSVLTLSNAEAPAALDQLSGEIHASTKTALLQDDRFAREAALGRLRSAQGSADADAGQVARETSRGTTFWTQGFGAWSRWDGDRDAADMKRNVGGLFIGGDTQVADNVTLGVMAGYSRSSLHVDDRASSATVKSHTLGAYAGDAWGAFSLKGGVAGGWHNIDTSRSIAFTGFADSLHASYKARTFQAYTEAAYGIESGKTRFEPFANLAYETLHTDGYRENGGAAALTANGQSDHATFSTLGLRAGTPLAFGAKSARLSGSLGWRRAYGGTPSAMQRFALGGDAFTVDGVALARNVLAVDAGFELDLTKSATMRLSYNGQFGSGVSDQGARLGVDVAF